MGLLIYLLFGVAVTIYGYEYYCMETESEEAVFAFTVFGCFLWPIMAVIIFYHKLEEKCDRGLPGHPISYLLLFFILLISFISYFTC